MSDKPPVTATAIPTSEQVALSQQSPSPRPRSSSAGSEKTLVDATTLKHPASNTIKKIDGKVDDDEITISGASSTSESLRTSLPKRVNNAMKRVKTKLTAPEPQPRNLGSYRDTAYMWRALAETKM
ncbi:hypothetical protein F5B20DRAFT_24330 [Whalleya microplaca]|nr:hypothetical protein F5B20DRAFT_24330 [Whalleya microplaca]